MTLPAPARDDARATVARVRRMADSPRMRKLGALEGLWKGKYPDDLADFWDDSVPLAERAPCVSSGIVEAAGTALVGLVFGEGRYPATTCGEANGFGVAFSERERAALDDLVDEVEKVAVVPVLMAKLMEQGVMVGTSVVFVSVERGKLCGKVVSAKLCEHTRGPDGELETVTVQYRFDRPDDDGNAVSWWYRRVVDATTDTVHEAPARADGYEPEWGPPVAEVKHGFGFVPVYWHRNDPDASDCDPTDGSALFAGLEGEVLALDMAMSQRHRNGRYNGEPAMVRIGAGEAKPMGEVGPAVSGPPKGFSWMNSLTGAARRMFGGGSAVKKGPNRIWDLPLGSDAKLVESTGAGADILGKDVEGLERALLRARNIVMVSPETLSSNASAAMLREIYAPMVNLAGRYRAEYGGLLVEVLGLLLRVACAAASQGKTVALRTLAAAMPALTRCTVMVQTDTGAAPLWVGVPVELAWGDYFEPTWQDVTQAIQAAVQGNGGRAVLTLEQSVRLVAKIAGGDDVKKTVAQLIVESDGQAAQSAKVLGTLGGPAGPPGPDLHWGHGG